MENNGLKKTEVRCTQAQLLARAMSRRTISCAGFFEKFIALCHLTIRHLKQSSWLK